MIVRAFVLVERLTSGSEITHLFSALVATAEESGQHSCFVMGPLTQLFAHQLKQLRKFIDAHDQITYPFPLKAGNNSSSETQRGRYLLGGRGKV